MSATSALFLAAQQNDVRALQRALLEAPSEALSTSRNAKSKTVLMVAAEAGCVATVVQLLLHGADWKTVDRDGQTAQSSAVACGCVNTSAVLEAWSQQADRKDLEYRSTVPELKVAHRQKLVNQLCERAVEGDAARIVALLPRLVANEGPDKYVDAADRFGVTALYAASRGNHVDAIDALVGSGCTLDTVDEQYGWTACMAAASHGAVEAVETLAKHGADIWLEDQYENTALDIAREGKQKAVVKVLQQFSQGNG